MNKPTAIAVCVVFSVAAIAVPSAARGQVWSVDVSAGRTV